MMFFTRENALFLDPKYIELRIENIAQNATLVANKIFASGNTNISFPVSLYGVLVGQSGIFVFKSSSSDLTGVEGGVYYNSSSKKLRYYDGTAWKDLGSGGVGWQVHFNNLQVDSSYNSVLFYPPSGSAPVVVFGNHVTLNENNAYDLGDTNNRWRTIFSGELRANLITADFLNSWYNTTISCSKTFRPSQNATYDLGDTNNRWRTIFSGELRANLITADFLGAWYNTIISCSTTFRPSQNATYDLGTSSFYWNNLYINRIFVNNTDVVTNLNADRVDSYHLSDILNTVWRRDASSTNLGDYTWAPSTANTGNIGSSSSPFRNGYFQTLYSANVTTDFLNSWYNTTIASTKTLRPSQNATYDLGTSSFYWNNLYINRIFVNNTDVVTNLNADRVDNYHLSDILNTVWRRDANCLNLGDYTWEPNSPNTGNIGSSGFRFRNGYFQNLYCTNKTSGMTITGHTVEEIEIKDNVEDGDVVVFEDGALKKTSTPNHRFVFGVADTNQQNSVKIVYEKKTIPKKDGSGVIEVEEPNPIPATYPRPVILGIFKIKVLGPVEEGDFLVTSHEPGYAMVNNNPLPGTVIAQALERFEGERGIINAMIRKF